MSIKTEKKTGTDSKINYLDTTNRRGELVDISFFLPAAQEANNQKSFLEQRVSPCKEENLLSGWEGGRKKFAFPTKSSFSDFDKQTDSIYG